MSTKGTIKKMILLIMDQALQGVQSIFAVFICFVMLLVMFAAIAPVYAATTQAGDPGWPRLYKKGNNQLTVYQPQVDYWKTYTDLRLRCAIALKPGGAKEEKYGIVEVNASTVVDHDARVVMVMPSKREVRFPNIPDSETASLQKMVDELMPPKQAVSVSLDLVLAYMEPEEQPQRTVEVNLDPPKIFYSSKPAVLVIFMGAPQFKPVKADKNDLMFAVNTNWDVFYETTQQHYYLLNGNSWMTAQDAVKGPWTATMKIPAALSSLPADDNWADVRKNVPAKSGKISPIVYATSEPAELIVTEGDPGYSPIPGTKLMRVANTESTLFMHSGEGLYYFLVAGRWFSTKTLNGPWAAASKNLPVDFTNIPDDDPAAYIKASVPGTREAKDALLLASIPKTTTVNIAQVKEQASYEGDPNFMLIEGTTVKYAVNSPYSIFLVGSFYYWCYEGAWLVGSTANGPWTFATAVPAAIYTIPSTHPTYNVTYVVVQTATPTTVTYIYTSGYSGEYVAATGVLMFGMGMIMGAAIASHDHYYYYRGPVYSYGCGAVYHHGYGGYYRSAHVYGPYGGAGRGAAYNPHTGTYARGVYAHGPAGSASFRQAYNPYTGAYAQSTRVNTAYGSAGRGYAERDGKSAWGGYRSGPAGSAAGVRTSEGSGAAAWDTRHGQGAVVKGKEGNVYAGKDGNVYKRENNGNWSSNSGSGWKNIDKAQTNTPHSVQNLESQAKARQWGTKQSERTTRSRSVSSTTTRSGGRRRK